MGNFNDFIDAVKNGAKDLARKIFDDFEAEARSDTKVFLNKIMQDMERWTRLLADGELTESDFRDLVQAKKALAEIHALRQKGIAMTKIEQFRRGLIDLVIDSAIETFL
jgi:hypothetical protein